MQILGYGPFSNDETTVKQQRNGDKFKCKPLFQVTKQQLNNSEMGTYLNAGYIFSFGCGVLVSSCCFVVLKRGLPQTFVCCILSHEISILINLLCVWILFKNATTVTVAVILVSDFFCPFTGSFVRAHCITIRQHGNTTANGYDLFSLIHV